MFTHFNTEINRSYTLRNEHDRITATDVFVHKYHVPPEQIQPKTILDLGCNIGLTVLHYEELYPTSSIIGVELDSQNVELALKNTNSTIIHAAIAAQPGTKSYKSTEPPYAYKLSEDGDTKVRAMTLQELISTRFGYVDFVKMDIEGTEFDIITPTADLCDIGSMLIEVHTQSRMDEIMEILRGHKFRVSKHPTHWSSVWAIR